MSNNIPEDKRFFKKKNSSFVVETTHIGDDYVVGRTAGKPDVLLSSWVQPLRLIEWCEDPDKIKVGDEVRLKGLSDWYKVAAVFRESEESPLWVVFTWNDGKNAVVHHAKALEKRKQ